MWGRLPLNAQCPNHSTIKFATLKKGTSMSYGETLLVTVAVYHTIRESFYGAGRSIKMEALLAERTAYFAALSASAVVLAALAVHGRDFIGAILGALSLCFFVGEHHASRSSEDGGRPRGRPLRVSGSRRGHGRRSACRRGGSRLIGRSSDRPA